MGRFLNYIISFFKKQEPSNFSGSTPSVDYSKTYNSHADFKSDFYLNLQKTIVWTEEIISRIEKKSKINYGRVLRTTNPVYQGRPFYIFSDTVDYLAATPAIRFDYNAVLTEALSVRKNTILPNRKLEEIGRILKFEIDQTTHDGAPCAESGFVDESDIPPIDTWFYITTKYLYCWIPAMFISKMQDAIDVEIFGSYHWFEEIDPKLNREIFDRLQQASTKS